MHVAKGGETTYITKTDIFYYGRVDLASSYNLLEQFDDNTVDCGVFETSFAGLCEGSADSQGNDYIVWVLLQNGVEASFWSQLGGDALKSCSHYCVM